MISRRQGKGERWNEARNMEDGQLKQKQEREKLKNIDRPNIPKESIQIIAGITASS